MVKVASFILASVVFGTGWKTASFTGDYFVLVLPLRELTFLSFISNALFLRVENKVIYEAVTYAQEEMGKFVNGTGEDLPV